MSEVHTCGLAPEVAEDEALFSGYIDQVLTQGDEQRVRVRLENCAACALMVEELRVIRENARTTRFVQPDRQWDENPQSALSRALRTLGWASLGIWLVVNVIWLLRIKDITDNGLRWWFILSLVGWAALLISVLLDRLQSGSSDRYRGVHK